MAKAVVTVPSISVDLCPMILRVWLDILSCPLACWIFCHEHPYA